MSPRRLFPLSFAACLLSAVLASAVQAGPLDVGQFESCGIDLTPPQDCEDCQVELVFEPEGYWHGLGQCTRDIRDAWARFGPDQPLDIPGQPRLADFARDQILAEMAAPDVRFVRKSDSQQITFAEAFGPDLRPEVDLASALLINDRQEAYNGMGQSGLAYFLFQFAAQAEKGGYDRAAEDAALFRRLGELAIAAILTPVEDGGLKTSTVCAEAPELECSWYHSVTRRDWATSAGATLNQMLHVLRDMAQIHQMSTRFGWQLEVDLPSAIEAGLNQLFLSAGYLGPGTAPNLADFNSDETSPSAWAYYGFDAMSPLPAKGYFLKNHAKNCSYHAHDLQLLQAVLKRARTLEIAPKARSAARTSDTLAAFVAALSVLDEVPKQIECSAPWRKKIERLRRELERQPLVAQ